MSLHEVSAHLFYGVRLQRMGRDADPNPPLVGRYDYLQWILEERGLWREVPDEWQAALAAARKRDCKVHSLRDLPPDHEANRLYAEHRAAVRAQTYGCELLTMGSQYDEEDWVVYLAIEESETWCQNDYGHSEAALSPDQLEAGADWDSRLTACCAKLDVPANLVRPRWTLSLRGGRACGTISP